MQGVRVQHAECKRKGEYQLASGLEGIMKCQSEQIVLYVETCADRL